MVPPHVLTPFWLPRLLFRSACCAVRETLRQFRSVLDAFRSSRALALSLYPLAGLGYTTPTPVQARSIPIVLTGSDLLGRAQTGTGKTAAFGLPMIDRLVVRGRRTGHGSSPRGLVLVPTRELAMQVHKALATYGAGSGLRTVAVFGGVSMGAQVQALRRGTDIVVATPGRLLDHMQQRSVDLSEVEILTLDEADRMLDMGFLPPLRRVLAALPRQRQTLLFSATISNEVAGLAGEFTREPARVDVSPQQIVAATVDTPRASGLRRAEECAVDTRAAAGPRPGRRSSSARRSAAPIAWVNISRRPACGRR